jgi:putative DNA primase/helicase
MTLHAFDPSAVPPRADFDACDWGDPEPLASDLEPEKPYPLDALPGRVRAAVLEHQAYAQQPTALIALSALSALSLAAQHLADVARDDGLSGPCSLNTLTIAISGERKTSADMGMSSGLRTFEAEMRAAASDDLIRHGVAIMDFKLRREALAGQLKEARKGKANEQKVEKLRRTIEDLDLSEPVAPPERILFHSDSTSERLALDLAAGWPSSSLWSNEGGIVAGGHAMRDETAMATIAMLNVLWEGQTYRRRRARAESAELRGVRLTCALMVQPLVFRHLTRLAGGAVRGMGLFARFLLAWPTSTMGTRLYKTPTPGMPAGKAFQERLIELASIEPEFQQDERGRRVYQLRPEVLSLSPAAFEIWREFHDDVERELGAEGALAEVPDVASKTADNAARLACLSHLFERGPGGAIGERAMKSGAAIALWHLLEAKRVFGLAKRDAAAEAAIALLKWMLGQKSDTFGLREIQRGAPRALRRDGALRAAAIDLLGAKFWLARTTVNGADAFKLHPDSQSLAKEFKVS